MDGCLIVAFPRTWTPEISRASLSLLTSISPGLSIVSHNTYDLSYIAALAQ